MNNLIDQIFHNLTVLERISNFEGRKRTYYKCKCVCGTITYIEGSKLLNGHTKSCGCFKIKQAKNNYWNRKQFGESLKNRLYDSYKRNAKNRNNIFNLTKEEVFELFKQNCYYCGVIPSKKIIKKGFYGYFIYNGIDRLDNNKGYTKENSVSCCSFCNYTKNKTDFKEFIVWIRKVYNHTKNMEI